MTRARFPVNRPPVLPARGATGEAPAASTVVIVDLTRDTRAYCDLYRGAPPILVVNAGATEVQFSFPARPVTVEDLLVVDGQLEAWAAFRAALLRELD